MATGNYWEMGQDLLGQQNQARDSLFGGLGNLKDMDLGLGGGSGGQDWLGDIGESVGSFMPENLGDVSSILEGLGAAWGGYNGYQANKMGRKQLKRNRKVQDLDIYNRATAGNAQVANQARSLKNRGIISDPAAYIAQNSFKTAVGQPSYQAPQQNSIQQNFGQGNQPNFNEQRKQFSIG